LPPITNELHAGPLTLKVEREENLRRIRLVGELDLANARAVDQELNEAFADGQCEILVDMRELTFIDSTGLALLVAAIGRDGDGKRLRFVPSSAPAVTRVLQVTGLDARLPLSEASAAGDSAANGSLGTLSA
jgi:anti-sigma B factor antagonist